MLFILPSLVLLIALAWIYLVWGDVAVVAGIFMASNPPWRRSCCRRRTASARGR